MGLATAATIIAWLAACAGLTLAFTRVRGKSLPRWLLWAHPIAAMLALVCLWTAVALWPGRDDTRFNAGTFVVTIAFVAGAFMFSLRKSKLPVPLLVIIAHGAVALTGCSLVLAGLVRALAHQA